MKSLYIISCLMLLIFSCMEHAQRSFFQTAKDGARELVTSSRHPTGENMLKFIEEGKVKECIRNFDSVMALQKADTLFVSFLHKKMAEIDYDSKLYSRLEAGNQYVNYHKGMLLIDARDSCGDIAGCTDRYYGMALLYGLFLHGCYLAGDSSGLCHAAAFQFMGDILAGIGGQQYASLFHREQQRARQEFEQTGRISPFSETTIQEFIKIFGLSDIENEVVFFIDIFLIHLLPDNMKQPQLQTMGYITGLQK